MKKLMKRLNFAIIGIMASAPAMAINQQGVNKALCEIGAEFKGIFSILQTLAFVGAGVTIAGWAWGYISKGKVDVVTEVKEKGVGMLIGFFLLFGIGTLLSIFVDMVGPDGGLGCDIKEFF